MMVKVTVYFELRLFKNKGREYDPSVQSMKKLPMNQSQTKGLMGDEES